MNLYISNSNFKKSGMEMFSDQDISTSVIWFKLNKKVDFRFRFKFAIIEAKSISHPNISDKNKKHFEIPKLLMN